MNKKLWLGLGSVASLVTPISLVVACGRKEDNDKLRTLDSKQSDESDEKTNLSIDNKNFIWKTLDNKSMILIQELEKLKHFHSPSLDVNSFIETVGQNYNKDIKEKFAKIEGYKAPSLANGIFIKSVNILKPFTAKNGIALFNIIISNGENLASKCVVVSYGTNGLELIAENMTNFSSPNSLTSEAAILPKSTTDVKKIFKNIIGYYKPLFKPGITTKKVVVKKPLSQENKVLFTVTITDGKNDFNKDVEVTFNAIDLRSELNKFKNFHSTSKVNDKFVLRINRNENIKDIFTNLDGYKAPTLSTGISIKKVNVQRPLTIGGYIRYRITVTDGENEMFKDIKVTFGIIALLWELEKVINFNSTDPKTSAAALLPKSNTNVKEILENITGYQKPLLLPGIFIKKIEVKEPLTKEGKVVFTVTITDGKYELNKNIEVKFGVDEITNKK